MRSATRSSWIMSMQRRALDVLGVAARQQAVGVQVGLAAELHDARGDLVGVALLLVGVLAGTPAPRLGVDARAP